MAMQGKQFSLRSLFAIIFVISVCLVSGKNAPELLILIWLAVVTVALLTVKTKNTMAFILWFMALLELLIFFALVFL